MREGRREAGREAGMEEGTLWTPDEASVFTSLTQTNYDTQAE